jgi:hypothetical protein
MPTLGFKARRYRVGYEIERTIMEDKFFLYCGLAVISVPTYFLIGKILFGNFDKFKDCLASQTRRMQTWADVKFAYFVALCGIAVYGEGILLLKYLPGIAKGIHACAKSIILFGI